MTTQNAVHVTVRSDDRPSQQTTSNRHRWWALALLCLAQFMVILDVTVVNVALPRIGIDLRLGRASLTWVVTAYTLCFGGLMLLGGRLADTVGRRRTFLVGVVTFTIASLASGLADNGTYLVTARAGQGVGAALLSPSALAIITTTFSGSERNRALGVWAAIGGVGAAVGVLAGGLLTQYASWRWAFFVNLPVGVIVVTLAPTLVAALRPVEPPGRVDLPGALTGTLATAAIIYGLVNAGDVGWSAPTSVGMLAAGFALIGLFIAVERVSVAPLVPLRLFRHRPLVAGQAVMLTATALLIASFFLNSLYLQQVLNSTPLETGLVFLPIAVAMIAGSQLGVRAIGQLGPRPVAAAGFAFASVGSLLLSSMTVDAASPLYLLAGFLPLAAGVGACFVTATTSAMADANDAAGLMSGLLNTGHELGATLGVASVSAVAGASVANGSNAGTPAADGFGQAFLACAVVAGIAMLIGPRLLPAGRLSATDRRSAH